MKVSPTQIHSQEESCTDLSSKRLFSICALWQDVQHQFEDIAQQARQQSALRVEFDMVPAGLVGDRPARPTPLRVTGAIQVLAEMGTEAAEVALEQE